MYILINFQLVESSFYFIEPPDSDIAISR